MSYDSLGHALAAGREACRSSGLPVAVVRFLVREINLEQFAALRPGLAPAGACEPVVTFRPRQAAE